MKQYSVTRNNALSPVDAHSQNAVGVYLAKDVYAFQRKVIRLNHILRTILEIIWTAGIVVLLWYVIMVLGWPE